MCATSKPSLGHNIRRHDSVFTDESRPADGTCASIMNPRNSTTYAAELYILL